MTQLPDLSSLSHDEKDALIRLLWAQVQALTLRVAALEARLGGPPKTPDNSSLPPSRGQKANHGEKPRGEGPRKGSLGRKGGGRMLAENPDATVIARAACCAYCRAALGEDDHTLAARYDKIDLPKVRPVVTRVERYAGHCHGCGATTLAPVPQGLEPGTPFRGSFRSTWGADFFAATRSIVGTAARRGIDAFQAISMTLYGQSVIAPG